MKSNNLAKNTFLLSIGAILNKGLTFLMIPLFSSWLSTEDYGTFDLLCTYITMLIPFMSLSVSEGVFRLGIESSAEQKKQYITSGLAIYLIGGILFGILTFLIFFFLKVPIIIPFYLLFLGEFFNKYLQSFLRAIKKLNIYSYCSIILTLFIFISVYLFVKVLDLNLNGIIYGYALGYLIGNVIIIVWSKYFKYITKKISKEKTKDIIKYSLPLIPNSLSWWIVDASDRTIISFILGSISNGIYAIAYKIPNLCTYIFNMFSIAWQETAIDINNSKERNKHYNLMYNKVILILLSLCSGILSCNYILFEFIFDKKYMAAHLYTPILVTSFLFCSISQFLGGIQISLKKTKENGTTTLIGAIANIVIHLSLIKFIGLYAAAISTMISNLIIFILRKLTIKKAVLMKFDNNNIVYIIIYLYLAITSYFYPHLPNGLNIFNIFIACIVLFIINKEIIVKISKKILRRK